MSVVGKLFGRVLIKRDKAGTECAIGVEDAWKGIHIYIKQPWRHHIDLSQSNINVPRINRYNFIAENSRNLETLLFFNTLGTDDAVLTLSDPAETLTNLIFILIGNFLGVSVEERIKKIHPYTFQPP